MKMLRKVIDNKRPCDRKTKVRNTK